MCAGMCVNEGYLFQVLKIFNFIVVLNIGLNLESYFEIAETSLRPIITATVRT